MASQFGLYIIKGVPLWGRLYLYISFSHEFGFCTRSAFFTHESFCPNRHTPFIPCTRAVAIFLPAVLQAYAQPLCLPFSLLRHLWHVSVNPDLFAFFLEYWKGRWKQHQSTNCHIQVPTNHFWGYVDDFLWDNAAMPPAYRDKVHNCARFVDVSRCV